MSIRDDLTDAVTATDPPGWRRVEITHHDFERLAFQEAAKYKRVYLGRSHVTIPDLQRRYVLFTDYPATEGELARQYLRECYEASEWGAPPDRPRPNHPLWSWQAPLFCRPVEHRALAYVDLRHAYWSILAPYRADTALGADLHVSAGVAPFRRAGEIDADRSLRHAVVGVLFSHQLRWLRFGEYVTTPLCSPFSNPSLSYLTFATLHAVARELVRTFPVHAWLTDACVVDAGAAAEVIGHLEQRWGLVSELRAEGMGAVWSVSSYEVGPKSSADVANGNATRKKRSHDGLSRVNVEKLRRLRRHALDHAA